MSKSKSHAVPEEISTSALAALLGLTTSRIGQLVEQGTLKRTGRGLFHAAQSVRSYVEYRETVAAGEGGTSLTEERKRLTAERARIARLERRQLEAELIPADQIEPACLAWAANVRSHILAIPAKAAALLGMCTTAAERLALLRRLVNEALDELSRLPVVIPGAGEASEPEQAEATH